jgi:hypothetical protein
LGILGKRGLGRGQIGGFPDRKKRVFESDTKRLRTMGYGIFPVVNFLKKPGKNFPGRI